MIQVNCTQVLKKQKNFWSNIHFHPTDAIEDAWGQRILDEAAKDGAAQTVRMYAMLEDIVTMDESGNLQYDFTLNDIRMDYMLSRGFGLLVSYNFIPACIAIDPTETNSNSKNKLRYKGKTIIASPPRDYALWEEICYVYTKHIVERYGLENVSTWYLQCFNEPDIPNYFLKKETDIHKRAQEYLKLYRGFQSAIRRVSEKLRAGGPALAHNLVFLNDFLNGVRQEGLKFDFYCGHTYGTSPQMLNSGERPYHIMNNLERICAQCNILAQSGFAETPVIFDEWGASCCGFWNREECPALMLREDSRFAAYFGKLITACVRENLPIEKLMICLSGQHEMVTDFSGFRNLFTLNFFKKPIYNAYVLAAKLYENVLEAQCGTEGAEVLATADDAGRISVLVSYASAQFDRAMPPLAQTLTLNGVSGRRSVTVWCIDEAHTNPYTRMLREGMDEGKLFGQEIALLREEGCLKPVLTCSAEADGCLEIPLEATNNALLLVQVD